MELSSKLDLKCLLRFTLVVEWCQYPQSHIMSHTVLPYRLSTVEHFVKNLAHHTNPIVYLLMEGPAMEGGIAVTPKMIWIFDPSTEVFLQGSWYVPIPEDVLRDLFDVDVQSVPFLHTPLLPVIDTLAESSNPPEEVIIVPDLDQDTQISSCF